MMAPLSQTEFHTALRTQVRAAVRSLLETVMEEELAARLVAEAYERSPHRTELNPIAWVWSHLKIADLANVACDFLSELDVMIQKAKKRMQRTPDLIQAFILDAGYEV